MSHKTGSGGGKEFMTNEQLKVLFKSYLDQLRHDGKCEANLPQSDFEELKAFVRKLNYTISYSNVESVLNVHVDGKVIIIGGY
jgi:hypothetical protein